MYRSRPPLYRICSGFLSGEDTNAELRYLCGRGMATMSIALDLTGMTGFLVKLDMGFFIVFKGIEHQFLSDLHCPLLNLPELHPVFKSLKI